ncbi:ORF_064R [Scale drop disease virus]|uniref:ORF_064R n=1 Tax=Scale drop disease virus TaxID=1697349 RepID=A0A0K1L6I1_9VIRU|nr:ORF_064R [Scale drop disease virus]AKU37479.1 ORF_064R [Scale drop disease virus]UNH60719.1 RING E3 ubiquitin ligase [Scale drop disease virus]
MECSVCLQLIADKENDSRYAYLSTCTHVFCMDCIYTWKKINATCPVCRTEIGIIVPFKKPCAANSSRYKYHIKTYINKCKQITCKFDKFGICLYGNQCIYRHSKIDYTRFAVDS